MGVSLPEVHPSPLDAMGRVGRERQLSRHERDFTAAGDAPPGAVPGDQREAIACYLSAGEGWSEALKALRGAFASEAGVTAHSTENAQDKHEINHRTSEYLQWAPLKSAGTDND
jgi:hypothetical protein